jgi:hypothetical protein
MSDFPAWRIRIRVILVSTALFVYGVLSVPGAYAGSSVNVPLDNWAYEALERLAGFGLLYTELKGTRPYTRMEVGRLAMEALHNREIQSSKQPLADYYLERFQKEYRNELALWGWGDGETADTTIKPLDELQSRYVYSQGEPRRFRDGDIGHRIQATEGTPLVYNNEGVTYGQHHNFSTQFSSSIKVFDVLSGYVQPVFLARQNQGGFQDFDEVEARLLKGYGKLTAWNTEFEGGRDSLWWGQGRHGTLLLTNNATPLDLMKVSNPEPMLLPWVFRYLGPFKYTIMASRLEADRLDFPHPWLGGLRINFRPFPWFEFGYSGTFLVGGEGQPPLTFMDILRIFTFQNAATSGVQSDSLTEVDFRFQLPFLRNAELYIEFGAEDTGGPTDFRHLFDDIGYIVGIYFPRVTNDGRLDFRFEFADNAWPFDTVRPGYWYSHNIYTDGYTHDRLIMGHHMGPDAHDYFARSTYHLRNDLVIGLDFDLMQQGFNYGPCRETVYQMGADVTYNVTDAISVQPRYAFERVNNFNQTAGVDHQNHLFMVVMKWQF